MLDASHPMTQHHTSVEQARQLHQCESLKTCKIAGFVAKLRWPAIWHHSVTLIFNSVFDADWQNDHSDLSKCDNLIGVLFDSLCAFLLLVEKFLFFFRALDKKYPVSSVLQQLFCFLNCCHLHSWWPKHAIFHTDVLTVVVYCLHKCMWNEIRSIFKEMCSNFEIL